VEVKRKRVAAEAAEAAEAAKLKQGAEVAAGEKAAAQVKAVKEKEVKEAKDKAAQVKDAGEKAAAKAAVAAAASTARREQDADPLEKLRVNITTEQGGDPAEVQLAYLAVCTRNWNDDRVLGQGTFGQVYRGIDEARGIRFIVKRINLNSLSKISDDPSRLGRKMWEREVEALTRFSNPNIVKLFGFTPPTVDVKNICLVCYPLNLF
jgi:hypothetical protein